MGSGAYEVEHLIFPSYSHYIRISIVGKVANLLFLNVVNHSNHTLNKCINMYYANSVAAKPKILIAKDFCNFFFL